MTVNATSLEDRLTVLSAVLYGHRFSIHNEDALQRGIAQVLETAGAKFRREAGVTPRGVERVDFLIEPGIAIEVKVQGSVRDVERQLRRYAEAEGVLAILLVTTRMQHRAMPAEMDGKPVRVVYLAGSVL